MSKYLSSLRLRALIASVLVVVGLSVVYSYNASRLVLSGGQAEAEASIKQAAEMLNLASAPYTSTGGFIVLQDFLDGMLGKGEENGLIYLVILSSTGGQIISAGRVPLPLPKPDLNVSEAVKNGIVHVSNPILLTGNQVGFLQFGISTKHILQTQEAIQREGLIISIGIALLVISVVFTAGIAVARRINRLVEASKMIADGEYKTVRADDSGNDEIAALANNFNLMAVAISNKINEVRRGQEEVEELNASLENMVSLRTKQLEAKNEELANTIENLNQTRESLVHSEKLAGLGAIVAGVAHELNTPIGNALTVSSSQSEKTRTFAKELEAGLKRSTLKEYVDGSLLAADLIQRNLTRAAELVQSFKQVAVDQSSEQKRVFNLKETVNEYLLMLHMRLKKTPYIVEVDIPEDMTMYSYPGPLGQVITNFINNTLLHGFDGRDHGLIRIGAEKREDGWIKLSYSDDGKGIPAKNLPRIFDPFFTTRLGQGGSGLGLNIVFNIVTKLLGGMIEVSSKLGKGVTFELILPQTVPEQNKGKE